MKRISSQNLLIIGFGTIGKILAKRVSSLGIKVLAYDEFLSEEEVKKYNVIKVSWEEGLKQADYISVNLKGCDENINKLSMKDFKLMKNILTTEFPILFIDECQDTQRELLKSLIQTQQNNKETFCLGLFGDSMQQIYSSGYSELINNLPEDWKKPCKINNYRCPSRIVNLINKINKTYNSNNYIEQIAQKNQTGIVRVFILNKNIEDKLSQEQIIREKMSVTCQDLEWKDIKNVKTLVLEHAMAANRSGFGNFFLPLSQDSIIRDNLLQNTGINIQFLLEQVLPLVNSIKNNNNFETMRILEKYSPLMNNEIISNNFVLLFATFNFKPSAISFAIIGSTFGPIDVVTSSTSPIAL